MLGEKFIVPESPKVGEVYAHYKKGDNYKVYAIALHSDDGVWMVVYEPMYENPSAPLFTKTLSSWNEEVEWEGKMVGRFSLVY